MRRFVLGPVERFDEAREPGVHEGGEAAFFDPFDFFCFGVLVLFAAPADVGTTRGEPERTAESAVFFDEFDAFVGEREQFPERVVAALEDDPPGVVDRFAAFQADRRTIAECDHDAADVRVDLGEQPRRRSEDQFPAVFFAFGVQFEFVFGEVFFSRFFAFFFKFGFVFAVVFFSGFFAFFFEFGFVFGVVFFAEFFAFRR